MSHRCRQEIVSCYSSRETDLQSLPLLLLPLLHLLQLCVQSLGRLPELHTLLLIIPDLKCANRHKVTCSIRLNLANYLNLRARQELTDTQEKLLICYMFKRLFSLAWEKPLAERLLNCADRGHLLSLREQNTFSRRTMRFACSIIWHQLEWRAA